MVEAAGHGATALAGRDGKGLPQRGRRGRLRASGGIAVEELADGAAEQRRGVPDHRTEQPRATGRPSRSSGVAEDRVHERLLSSAPRALEVAKTALFEIGAAHIEGAVPVRCSPADGFPEENIVRSQVEKPFIGGAVLVDQGASPREEDRRRQTGRCSLSAIRQKPSPGSRIFSQSPSEIPPGLNGDSQRCAFADGAGRTCPRRLRLRWPDEP